MQRLFRSFEQHGVRQLLISGQAAVLYGAASFSEDVDVWIEPGPANVVRFARALAALDATVYKLTPAWTRRNVRIGHAFHFLVPDEDGPLYLDVMPRPPRVGPFASAWRRRRRISSTFGEIDLVAIEDLVELKKTRRLADYDVITTLVALRVRQERAPSRPLLEWAARNSFRAPDRAMWLRRLGRPRSEADCQRQLLAEMSRLQRKDTEHWSAIVDDLRRLRSRGRLLEDGTPVRRVVRG